MPRNFVARVLDKAARNDTRYDPYLAYALSVIAGWSYADGQTLSNKLRYYGLPFNTVDEVSVVNPAMHVVASAFFVRSECGRVGVLSFRGADPTDAIRWLTDGDVARKPFAYGEVHGAFYANLQALWDEVSSKLMQAAERAEHDGASVAPRGIRREPLEILYLTGHGLGGAMAVLAAAKICANEGPIAQWMLRGVYTFGQPAVGDHAFAEQGRTRFGHLLFRHVFGDDVIPAMPPRSCGSFEHFGDELASRSPREPFCKQDEPSVRQCHGLVATLAVALAAWVARRLPPLAELPFRYSIDDHAPSRYIDASRVMLLGEQAL